MTTRKPKIERPKAPAELNQIQRVLRMKGEEQKFLVEKLGRSANTVSQWCTNKQQPPLAELWQIARVLNVDIRELLIPTKGERS